MTRAAHLRAARVEFSGGVGGACGVGGGGVAEGVFAAALGGVHAFVRGAQDVVYGVGRVVEGDDADADGDGPARAARLFEESPARAAHCDLCGARVRLGHEDGELVAAYARDRVHAAHVAPESVRKRLQQTVSRAVALPVVDLLEVVDVYVGDAEGVRVPARARYLGGGELAERAAVERAGQIVCAGHLTLVRERELEGRDYVRDEDYEAE